jgi:hypothetical protein
MNLKQTILEKINALPEGALIFPFYFSSLASEDVVNKCFVSLVKEGVLYKLFDEAYVPVYNGKPPSVSSVLKSVSLKLNETIVTNGEYEAVNFGLASKCTNADVYLTSGPDREFMLGDKKVTLKHADEILTVFGNTLAGRVVRALSFVGVSNGDVSVKALKKKLNEKEWKTLEVMSESFPEWMSYLIKNKEVTTT